VRAVMFSASGQSAATDDLSKGVEGSPNAALIAVFGLLKQLVGNASDRDYDYPY